MTSVIHFKMRSALTWETVNFAGDYLSLADLKKLIVKKKGLTAAFTSAQIDLSISEEGTNEGDHPSYACARHKKRRIRHIEAT